jgi:MFS family permease
VVLGSVFLSQIAAFIQLFLVLFLIARGFRTEQAGVALGFFSVGAIFGTFGGGALADLLGPRWTIVLSTFGQGLFTMALPLSRNLAVVCGASALAGAGARSATTASATLLFQLVPKERRVMMSAMRMWVTNGGLVVAPLLGAALSAISWDLLFWVEAAPRSGTAPSARSSCATHGSSRR